MQNLLKSKVVRFVLYGLAFLVLFLALNGLAERRTRGLIDKTDKAAVRLQECTIRADGEAEHRACWAEYKNAF